MDIIRSWREQKVMLKWRFPFLTDADLDYATGEKDRMLKALASKLKKTKLELDNLFAELQKQ